MVMRKSCIHYAGPDWEDRCNPDRLDIALRCFWTGSAKELDDIIGEDDGIEEPFGQLLLAMVEFMRS